MLSQQFKLIEQLTTAVEELIEFGSVKVPEVQVILKQGQDWVKANKPKCNNHEYYVNGVICIPRRCELCNSKSMRDCTTYTKEQIENLTEQSAIEVLGTTVERYREWVVKWSGDEEKK